MVKVKKKDLEAFFTCSLCSRPFDSPTTISECFHIFCRSCIEDKLIAAKLKAACPVCNVDLGGLPLDKLRTDHSWDNMKLKLFPRKQESVKTGPETVAVSLESSKKKEKSISSLLASSSGVSLSPNLNQDAPLEPNVPVVEKLSEKMEAKQIITFRKRERKTSRPKNITEYNLPFDLNTVPDCELAEASTSQGCVQKEKNSEKDKEVAPLNINDTPQVIVVPEPAIITPNGRENQDCVLTSSEEDTGEKLKNNGKGIQQDSTSSSGKVSGEKLKNNGKGKQICVTPRKTSAMKLKEKSYSPPVLRSRVRGRAISSAASTSGVDISLVVENEVEVNISLVAENEVEGRNIPVWFKLVASNQNTDRPLPQIPVISLKVNNGNMSVSHVKKYIVQKLGLESEDEVEIWLRDELVVCSSQTLHNLLDWWVQTTPIEKRKSAMVGSSAAEFLMVLHYCLKVTSDHSDSE